MQLALEVGVQTPMGAVMQPQVLGTLEPGAAMWMPVLLAEGGLLCVRPVASSAVHLPSVVDGRPRQRARGGGGAAAPTAASPGLEGSLPPQR